MGISGSDPALMYARASSSSLPTIGSPLYRAMRSGASRSDYYPPVIFLSVNGANRQHQFNLHAWSIEDLMFEQPNKASVEVFGFTPVEGQEIAVGIGASSNYLFRGTITKVTQVHEKLTSRAVYALTCIDWSYLGDRRLVNQRWTSTSATTIAQQIVSGYCSGFTSSNVAVGLATVSEFTVTMEPVSTALTRLANQIGAYWYWDYEKDLHFFLSESTQTPGEINASNREFRHFTYTRELDQIRTRVSVEGGGGVTTAAAAVGATSIAVDECSWYSASGGSLKVPYGQILTYTGRSAASGPGNLTGIPGSGTGSILTALKIGDDVNLLEIRNDAAAQTALAALEGGDGIHEVFVQDRRLSIAGAQARGDAELAAYKSVLESGTFTTEDKFCRSGKTQVINMAASWGVALTAKIQSVRLYMVPGRDWPQRDVTYASRTRDLMDILRELQEQRGN